LEIQRGAVFKAHSIKVKQMVLTGNTIRKFGAFTNLAWLFARLARKSCHIWEGIFIAMIFIHAKLMRNRRKRI